MRDQEHLIRVFMIDGPPYGLRYRKLGHARKDWKVDLKIITPMIKEGSVKVVHQDRTTITYQYFPMLLVDGNKVSLKEFLEVNTSAPAVDHISKEQADAVTALKVGQSMTINVIEVKRLS